MKCAITRNYETDRVRNEPNQSQKHSQTRTAVDRVQLQASHRGTVVTNRVATDRSFHDDMDQHGGNVPRY